MLTEEQTRISETAETQSQDTERRSVKVMEVLEKDWK
jgi:hypothetical protein